MCCQEGFPTGFADHQNTECMRKYLKLQKATCTCFHLPCLQQEGWVFFVDPTQRHYTRKKIPVCFLEVSNAHMKLALMKSQRSFWENTVHIVRFRNRLNYRPVVALQTKLMDVTSLLDSGSHNSIDSGQWCIITDYGRALEKLKASFTLISSEWLHIIKFCLDTGGGNLQSQDTWHYLSDKRWMCSWADLVDHFYQKVCFPFLVCGL